MIVLICIGSSCHIKGSMEIVELMQKSITEHNLADDVVLSGSLCIGKCNRFGVTIQVDDDIFTGITPANFIEFFNDKILKVIQST